MEPESGNPRHVDDDNSCADTVDWPRKIMNVLMFYLNGIPHGHDLGAGYMFELLLRVPRLLMLVALTRCDPPISIGVDFSSDEIAEDDWDHASESGPYDGFVMSWPAFVDMASKHPDYLAELGLLGDIDPSKIDGREVCCYLPTYLLPMIGRPVFRVDHVIQRLNFVVGHPVLGCFFSTAKLQHDGAQLIERHPREHVY